MAEIMVPNLVGAVSQGLQAREQMQTGQARNRLAQIAQTEGASSPAFTNALMAVDPIAGARMQAMQAETRQAASKDARLRYSAPLYIIDKLPPDRQAAAYGSLYSRAQRDGLDLAGVPTPDQYQPGMAGMLAAYLSGEQPKAADPWDGYKVVGNSVLGMGERGPAPVWTAPRAPEKDPIAELRARADEAGLVPGSPEWSDFMINGGVRRTQEVVDSFRPATAEEAASYGAEAGQINERTGRFHPANTRDAATSEGERKAKGFLDRMEAAEKILQGFYGQGYTTPSIGERALNTLLPEGYALGEDDLQVRQAQRDWVRSKLRFESGAVIGDEEADEEIRTYFPQPGDGPGVIQQKAQARQQAMEAMRAAAGRAGAMRSPGAPDAPAPPQAAGGFSGNVEEIPVGTRLRNPQDPSQIVEWNGTKFVRVNP
ncbi:hypothetical protein [Albimonas pacifica]|uniref:Uncharacterized protein n=1 Tax=Albimonas pacifica TaxID=1114924 RepID=A0A1I3LIC5_9RHOB|nr:hypothetical protein [Albimonas pacifica]SFI84499.1 hypothetical protein SAMN05216258_11044 [Albimonas pacifica]